MVGPFSPWDHPLANDKESFYFVGHYWGLVALSLYRMCFPLRLAQWWHRLRHGRPRLVFDGCASYFSAPWVAAQLAALHRRPGARPQPLLIVCVREPVDQHLSWWRLERGAMAWGSSMCLGETYLGAPERVGGYPPASLEAALALSRSRVVRERWADAEALCSRPGGAAGTVGALRRLPDWAMPFPNGQLSAFDSMGRYADNLERWLEHFERSAFVVVELNELSRDPQLVLHRIAARCEALFPELRVGGGAVGGHCGGRSACESGTGSAGAEAIGRTPIVAPKLNASSGQGAAAATELSELSEHSLRALARYYRPHNERLEKLIGRSLGWHEAYAYYEGGREGAAAPHPC